MKTYISKNLFEVLTNDRERIIVKSDPETLENMMLNNRIHEWSVLTIHKYERKV